MIDKHDVIYLKLLLHKPSFSCITRSCTRCIRYWHTTIQWTNTTTTLRLLISNYSCNCKQQKKRKETKIGAENDEISEWEWEWTLLNTKWVAWNFSWMGEYWTNYCHIQWITYISMQDELDDSMEFDFTKHSNRPALFDWILKVLEKYFNSHICIVCHDIICLLSTERFISSILCVCVCEMNFCMHFLSKHNNFSISLVWWNETYKCDSHSLTILRRFYKRSIFQKVGFHAIFVIQKMKLLWNRSKNCEWEYIP